VNVRNTHTQGPEGEPGARCHTEYSGFACGCHFLASVNRWLVSKNTIPFFASCYGSDKSLPKIQAFKVWSPEWLYLGGSRPLGGCLVGGPQVTEGVSLKGWWDPSLFFSPFASWPWGEQFAVPLLLLKAMGSLDPGAESPKP
jgi:hypothetical protein